MIETKKAVERAIKWRIENRDRYNEIHRIYYSKHKEQHKKLVMDWKKRNRERWLESRRKWYAKNRERLLEQYRIWRLNNPEKIKKIYTKSESRPERIKYKKQWKKKNKDKVNFSVRKRRYLLKGAIGSHTLEQWEELKRKYNYCCAMCGKSEPEIKLTEDHIIPISKGGTNDISNIQPLCVRCNSIKNDRTDSKQIS